MILACTILIQSHSVTDEQTDRRTDRWTDTSTKHSAVARKNPEPVFTCCFVLLVFLTQRCAYIFFVFSCFRALNYEFSQCDFYGLEACPLDKSELSSLDFVVNKFFNEKMCRTSNMDVVRQYQFYFEFKLPSILWSYRVRTLILMLNMPPAGGRVQLCCLWYQCQIVPPFHALIVTSTNDELCKFINIDDLDRP